MAIDPSDFRTAMREWATGVSVCATDHQGMRHGMTVNSFTSISLTPPLVLVSLERKSRTHALVKNAGFFGVTILARHQVDVSDCFAGRHTEHENRFENVQTFTLATGAPFIAGGLAFFDCRVVSAQDVATHTIFIGEVVSLQINSHHDGSHPLIYHRQTYKGVQS
jgi:flavin reductase (DIM6/NTAB) family NADH-FMN oxidoreductase RutF